jgi:RimJ/RimL family protein N-acetyltransferase
MGRGMTGYTPEKVAELVAEARDRAAQYEGLTRGNWNTMADALTAVSADRDRLRKAITEALDWRDEAYHGAFGKDEFAQGYGYARRAIRRILRAALDKEGDDDE